MIERQTRGYAIVRLPDRLIREYEDGPRGVQNAEIIRQLRAATPHVDPASYRGYDRELLEAYPTDEKMRRAWRELGWQSNERARIRMGEITDDIPEHFDDDLLDSLDDAREVFELLDAPDEFEIILLERDVSSPVTAALGFDVGYWNGDHYSILNDSLVRPTWHGPALEDLTDLAIATRGLNRHVLFDDAAAAEAFIPF